MSEYLKGQVYEREAQPNEILFVQKTFEDGRLEVSRQLLPLFDKDGCEYVRGVGIAFMTTAKEMDDLTTGFRLIRIEPRASRCPQARSG